MRHELIAILLILLVVILLIAISLIDFKDCYFRSRSGFQQSDGAPVLSVHSQSTSNVSQFSGNGFWLSFGT